MAGSHQVAKAHRPPAVRARRTLVRRTAPRWCVARYSLCAAQTSPVRRTGCVCAAHGLCLCGARCANRRWVPRRAAGMWSEALLPARGVRVIHLMVLIRSSQSHTVEALAYILHTSNAHHIHAHCAQCTPGNGGTKQGRVQQLFARVLSDIYRHSDRHNGRRAASGAPLGST